MVSFLLPEACCEVAYYYEPCAIQSVQHLATTGSEHDRHLLSGFKALMQRLISFFPHTCTLLVSNMSSCAASQAKKKSYSAPNSCDCLTGESTWHERDIAHATVKCAHA